jgi:orotate phosphoribosyltransferase
VLRETGRRMLTNSEVMGIFRESGALLEGHFLLASGYHSGSYLEKFQVLQHPRYVETLCRDMAERFRDAGVQVVMGPTTGGMLIAYEVAKKLGTRAIFAERDDTGTGRTLRRGFSIAPGERVLVVDDILTTGGSVRDTIAIVDQHGGVLVGVGVLADRSGGSVTFGAPTEALLRLDVPKFAPDHIPDWLAAIPLTERGSSHNLAKTG